MKTLLLLLGFSLTGMTYAQIVRIPKELVKLNAAGNPKLKISEIINEYENFQESDTNEESTFIKLSRWKNYEFAKLSIENDSIYSYKAFNNGLRSWVSSSLNCSDQDHANWISIGPTDNSSQRRGWTDAVYRNPSNPSEVIIGTRTSGLFKSYNNGQNWTAVTDNLAVPFLGCRQLLSNAQNPNTIYALSGTDIIVGSLYKSTNGGATWQVINEDANFNWMVFLPGSSNKMVAVSRLNEIHYSADGGITWLNLGNLFSISANSELKRISLAVGKVIVWGDKNWSEDEPFYVGDFQLNGVNLSITNTQLGIEYLTGNIPQNTVVIGSSCSNRAASRC